MKDKWFWVALCYPLSLYVFMAWGIFSEWKWGEDNAR